MAGGYSLGGGSAAGGVSRQAWVIDEHFSWGSSGSGAMNLTTAATGTGAAVGFSAGINDGRHGLVTLACGTTSTGAAHQRVNNTTALRLGNAGTYFVEYLIRIPTLSNGTERFRLRLGFSDKAAADDTDPTDGVFFRYKDDVNSGNWELVARSNSTETVTNAASGPSTNTWHRLRIEVNNGGTLCSFYMDDVLLGTVASNIPNTAARLVGIGHDIAKSLGTTDRTFEVDRLTFGILFNGSM